MNIGRYYQTLRYLKFTQLWYQLFYRVRQRIRKALGFSYSLSMASPNYRSVALEQGIFSAQSYQDHRSFTFLNQSHTYTGDIDWNYSEFGKLWTYNLTYFEFLNQDNMTMEQGESLLFAFMESMSVLEDGLEPYPISLRLINWVKFNARYTRTPSKDESRCFYGQALMLLDHLERHLLGNHYLENGFGLLFVAYAFRCEKCYAVANGILRSQLAEQILVDGAHFEGSPMYHQILLWRVLDSVNLVKNNEWHQDELCEVLQRTAHSMLAWLNYITFGNGDVPLVNDATDGIAPHSHALTEYANRLITEEHMAERTSLIPVATKEHVCNYRMIACHPFELFCDVGAIGPDYIPGHAHADSLSFVLYHQGRPLIVDPGISTYEKNDQRSLERSTPFHNTVSIKAQNSSDVWGGFRVGKRARIIQGSETKTSLEATHDGFAYLKIYHNRKWTWDTLNEIRIIDRIRGEGSAHIHFHPDVDIERTSENTVTCDGHVVITFRNATLLKVGSYGCANGYNRFRKATELSIFFSQSLETIIRNESEHITS